MGIKFFINDNFAILYNRNGWEMVGTNADQFTSWGPSFRILVKFRNGASIRGVTIWLGVSIYIN